MADPHTLSVTLLAGFARGRVNMEADMMPSKSPASWRAPVSPDPHINLEKALADIRAGRQVIVVDDEHRETKAT